MKYFIKDSSKKLTILQKISIVLLFMFSINLPGLFTQMLGINKLPDEAFMWVLPVLILVLHDIRTTLYKIPKEFFIFLILVFFFYISEQKFYRGYNYSSAYAYFFGFLKFYTIYFSLVIINKPLAVLKYLVRISQIIIIPLIFLFYFDYLFGIGLTNKISIDETGRYVNQFNFHINGLSFIAVYGIFLMIVTYELRMQSFNKALIKSLFFMGIIMLNSSRGAFLMSVICLLLFFWKSYRNLSVMIKPLFIIVSIIIITFAMLQLNFISNDVIVVRRLVNNEGTGRITQMTANLNNIASSPFFGVGQSLAGYDRLLRTTRSNVHFTQSIAAYGIILATVYFYFMFRLMGPIKNKMNIVAKMSLAVFLITFMSYNWTLILLLSFIAFINKTVKELG